MVGETPKSVSPETGNDGNEADHAELNTIESRQGRPGWPVVKVLALSVTLTVIVFAIIMTYWVGTEPADAPNDAAMEAQQSAPSDG